MQGKNSPLSNIQRHVPLSRPEEDAAGCLRGLALRWEVVPCPSYGSLFPWQEDEVVLQCIANIHKEQRKFCLAAEGLGNRLCFLEPTSEAKVRLTVCSAPSLLTSQAVIRGWDCWEVMMRVVRKKFERYTYFEMGMTQRDVMGREVGGGFMFGNACKN